MRYNSKELVGYIEDYILFYDMNLDQAIEQVSKDTEQSIKLSYKERNYLESLAI